MTAKIEKINNKNQNQKNTERLVGVFFEMTTIVQQNVKPLLFFIVKGGTGGDRKPLAILAVLAAHASLHKVTLAFEQIKHAIISIYHKTCDVFTWN